MRQYDGSKLYVCLLYIYVCGYPCTLHMSHLGGIQIFVADTVHLLLILYICYCTFVADTVHLLLCICC